MLFRGIRDDASRTTHLVPRPDLNTHELKKSAEQKGVLIWTDKIMIMLIGLISIFQFTFQCS